MSHPHSTPYDVVYDGRRSDYGSSQWNGPQYEWQPGNVTDDPHDDFDGDNPETGEVAPNILT
jgi:hypothetical protein